MSILTQLPGYRLFKGELLNQIIISLNGLVPNNVTNILAPKYGMAGANSQGTPKVWHTGELQPPTTTTGTDTTPVITELYVARVFIPTNTSITGLALLNGSWPTRPRPLNRALLPISKSP